MKVKLETKMDVLECNYIKQVCTSLAIYCAFISYTIILYHRFILYIRTYSTYIKHSYDSHLSGLYILALFMIGNRSTNRTDLSRS